MKIDHVLLAGFGGPRSREEVEPFLSHVAEGRNIPQERLKEVASHYEAIGGASPYNAEMIRIGDRLAGFLKTQGFDLPVFCGMRSWHPFFSEVIPRIRAAGLTRGGAIMIAPHRSPASCFRYREAVKAACAGEGDRVEYTFIPPWYDHPLFIEAQAEKLQEALHTVPGAEKEETAVVFTAHSIPVSMSTACRECSYPREVLATCRLLADYLGVKRWVVAYQSKSPSPGRSWLEPDICHVLQDLACRKVRGVVLVPVGFLLENAELLYDLDVEAKGVADGLGLRFQRVHAVMCHSKVIQLFAEQILQLAGVKRVL